MSCHNLFSDDMPAASTKRKATNALYKPAKRSYKPTYKAPRFGFSTRSHTMGFPDVLRTNLRYHEPFFSLDAAAGATAVYVFKLNG